MFKVGDYVAMKHHIYEERIMPLFKIKSIEDSKIRVTDIITEVTYLMVSNENLMGIEEAAEELTRYFAELEDYAKYNYNNLYTILNKYITDDDWFNHYKDFYEKTYRRM